MPPVRSSHCHPRGRGCRRASPAGELAQPLVEKGALEALSAQLQHAGGGGKTLGQQGGVLLGGAVQDHGSHTVYGLIAGDGDLSAQQCGIGEGGGGTGEGHFRQGGERRERTAREAAGEPGVCQLLRRQAQQRSGGGIGKAAYQIGHLPVPVGEYLRQQEGDPALHEWLGEPIQTLCHAALPPLKEKSAPLYRAAVRGAMPFRLRKGGSRKMHKKYYLSCGKVLWAGRKKALTGMEKTVIIFFKYIKIGGMRSKVGGAYEKGISGAAGRPGV